LGSETTAPRAAERFFERMKRMPTMNQASTYSATLHYLNFRQGRRHQGRPVLERCGPRRSATPSPTRRAARGRAEVTYVPVSVNSRGIQGPLDYLQVLAEVPGDQAFRPIKEAAAADQIANTPLPYIAPRPDAAVRIR